MPGIGRQGYMVRYRIGVAGSEASEETNALALVESPADDGARFGHISLIGGRRIGSQFPQQFRRKLAERVVARAKDGNAVAATCFGKKRATNVAS